MKQILFLFFLINTTEIFSRDSDTNSGSSEQSTRSNNARYKKQGNEELFPLEKWAKNHSQRSFSWKQPLKKQQLGGLFFIVIGLWGIWRSLNMEKEFPYELDVTTQLRKSSGVLWAVIPVPIGLMLIL